jgi:SAM-dependent methyltransferase
MEKIRRHHNLLKRQLLNDVVGPNSNVLDVGCGFGGDLNKWQSLNTRLTACDPDPSAVEEAYRRTKNLKYPVRLLVGDITTCPLERFDVICFNFSIHYIFQTELLFKVSVENIVKRIQPGGKLIGCIPDSDMIIMNTPFRDKLGNIFTRSESTGNGRFGEKLFVHLVDTPFYRNGARPEPIGYKDQLITALEACGVHLVAWQPLDKKGIYDISRMYSKFIFVREM